MIGDIIPVPDDDRQPDLDPSLTDLPQIVRGDVNIKRFGNFLFPHHRTKDLDRVREFQSDVKLSNGRTAKQKLVIKPAAGSKAYTTYTQRVYYALVLLWYEKGKPDGTLHFSLRELATKMNKQWGGDTAERLTREVECLKETTIRWVLAFETATSVDRDSIDGFSILDRYRIESYSEREARGTIFEASCTVVFRKEIIENIISNKISPLNFTALLSFRSSIAEMLYVRIDSLLARLEACQWNSGTLIDELRLNDIAEYSRNTATRRRLLERLARELNGKPISTGDTLVATVEQTADAKDWKLVCSKSRRRDLPPPLSYRPNLPVVNDDPEVIDYLAQQIADTVGYEEENAALYRKLARHYPQHVIHRVLAEFRQESPRETKNRGGFFIDKFHRIAHQSGLEWIKDCGASCDRRPGNSLI